MKNCFIVGGGAFSETYLPASAGDVVIAADAGYAALMKIKCVPHCVIGDFDSLGYVPEGKQVTVLPREKDDTDMAMAVEEGLRRGCDAFHIYGGCDGRGDHTYANIQLLAYLACHGKKGYLYSDTQRYEMLKGPGSVVFGPEHTGMISVFSYTDRSLGVTETGLAYGLDHAALYNCRPMGVSNEFCGQESRISVEDGMLLIVTERNEQGGGR